VRDLPTAVQRLLDATNRHDLEALVDCFTDDYVSETPVHPERNFTGRDQIRVNWTPIFANVPDITASVERWAEADGELWLEWTHRGTRPDGSAHEMRGVTVFGLRDDRFNWVRFYLEPVQRSTVVA
jgi:ketosteroid isomerase-like protein